jgi:GMP synthase (glutamine-hydrolysing)
MLAHRALGDRLKTFFIDNGLMREGEPQSVVALLQQCGAPVDPGGCARRIPAMH